MERNDNQEVIDLGTASIETKGPGGNFVDIYLTQVPAGLSDD